MIIHVLRKPLIGTVAANALAHGAGALNIDECRIGFVSEADKASAFPGGNLTAKSGSLAGGVQNNRERSDFDTQQHPAGRWPANLLHDGSEEVVETFPQTKSGTLHAQYKPSGKNSMFAGRGAFTNKGYGSDQFSRTVLPTGNNRMNAINLWDYLTKLISTPVPELKILRVDDPLAFDWQAHEDSTAHGMLVTRGVGDAWQVEALRVLKPGGHLLIASADDVDPTGSDCVCVAEDSGFEVRDAIFVATSESKFSYTTKATTSEREAGTHAIKEEDAVGKRGNFHPTVKPVEIMEWCLNDLPEGAHVVDPFLGSGTTGIACLNAHMNFTGIEITPDYLPIADARVRHWNSERSILEGRVIITSDCDTTPKQRDVDFNDFFGLGE